MPETHKIQRLLAICVLFFCILNFPVLTIVNKEVLVKGVPVLYLYFFIIWILMIASIMKIIDSKEEEFE
jgi:hypothetical protein